MSGQKYSQDSKAVDKFYRGGLIFKGPKVKYH